MSVGQLKLTNFNTDRKNTSRALTLALSTVTAELSKALEQQAYIHKNPDGNDADDFIALLSDEVDNIGAVLAEIGVKAQDLLAVKAGAVSIDTNISKYNIDLTSYSAQLL